MEHSNSKLTYFLSSKKGILIVSLIGPLTRANSPVFEQCIKEISKADAKWVVVNFRDVPNVIERHVFPSLVRLQKVVRDRNAELRLSGIHPDLLEVLGEQGIVRGPEISRNLAEALQSLSFKSSTTETATTPAPKSRTAT